MFTRKIKTSALSASAICVFALVLLAGCSANNNAQNQTENGSSQPPKQNTDSSVKVPVATGSAAVDGKSADVSVPSDAQQAFLLNIKKSANAGKVINCEFPLKITIEDVEAKWGKADKVEWIAAAKGTYSTYNQRNVVFGYNKGSEIFEVRSFDKQLSVISLSEVKKVLGVPEYQLKTKGQNIIGYTVGQDYKILFVFMTSFGNNNPTIDHYSVLYPTATKNNMADDPGRQW